MMVDAVLAACFGLLIGSFLNVCIYRLPRDLSVVRPRSHCVECQAVVKAWQNIPVLSFVLLRGRCSNCAARISLRYPLVELLTACCFAFFVGRFGFGWVAVRDCFFSAVMIALLFTDLETRILPEPLTIGGALCGLAFSLVVPVGDGTAGLFGLKGQAASLVDALLGAVIPTLALGLAGWLFRKARRKEGLGFGDLVLLSEIGVFLGLRGTLLTLVLASVAGSLIGGGYILLARRDAGSYELPLGSFLAGMAIVVMAVGSGIIRWYSALW